MRHPPLRTQILAPATWLDALLDPASQVTLAPQIIMGRYALDKWTIPRRTIPEHLLYWIVQGTIEGSYETPASTAVPRSTATLRSAAPPAPDRITVMRGAAGTLIWLAPNIPHQFTLAPGSRRLVIYNLRFQLTRRHRALRLEPDLIHLDSAVDLETAFATVADEIQAPSRHGAPLLKALLAQLAVRIFREAESASRAHGDTTAGNHTRRFTRFQRDQLARFAEATAADRPTPGDLARELQLSADYCARRFRLSYGVSPKRWLVEQRILRAAVQLTQSTQNVSEVARALGYPDLFLFSRQFKAVMGVSPRAYRHRAEM